jgi:hypothetical protein
MMRVSKDNDAKDDKKCLFWCGSFYSPLNQL